MSKLVFFLFLGICVMAVCMDQTIDEDDDAEIEKHLREIEPILKKKMMDDGMSEKEYEDWWIKNKPILREWGKSIKPVVKQVMNTPTTPSA